MRASSWAGFGNAIAGLPGILSNLGGRNRPGEGTLRSLSIAFSAALAIVVAVPLQALARPATHADLSGKSLCWNDGDRQNYSPNGRFSSTRWGEGTWKVTAHGVQIKAHPGGNGLVDIRLRHGTFSLTTYGNRNGLRHVSTAKYC